MNHSNNERRHLTARSGASAGAPQFDIHTVIVAIRCWWLVAAPLGLLLAVGAGGAIYYFAKPKYTAATWLIIRDQPEPLLKALSLDDPEKFVQNQLELMRSPSVIEPVAAIPEVASTPELSQGLNPAQALRQLAKIRAVGKSEFYVIEFTSVSRDKAALVSNELATKFLELQTKDESERTSNTIGLLKQRLGEHESAVKSLRENVQALAIQRTGKDPFDTRPEKDIVQVRSPLAELQSQLIVAEVDAAILDAQVQVDSELLKKQTFEMPPSELDRFVDEHPGVVLARSHLAANRGKLQDYERISTSLERNTPYQQLKKQNTQDESTLESMIAELRTKGKEALEMKARKAREDEVNALQRKQANSNLTVQILRQKFETQFKSQKDYAGDSVELEFLRADYERASLVLNAISDRILNLETEQKAPVRVKIHRPATPPASPDATAPYRNMLMAAMGAFFLPFGLAVGAEHLFRRVTNRDQLESAGKFAVVGEITVLPARGSKGPQHSGKPNRELQLFRECIDCVRTNLTLDESLHGFKTLALTSAVSREGKTNLAVQLAMSVASATGKPTLLIDGDLRSPDIHRAFDVERSPGLAEVLQGKCTIEDAVKTESSRAVHLLTAGTLTSSPHRLMGTGAFERLVHQLRESYAYIIIDTPPILAASESLVMARVADATILCVRRDFSRVRQVSEAYARLQTAGVKTAGAVLSGIPARDYRYRYGSYYYDQSNPGGAGSEEIEA